MENNRVPESAMHQVGDIHIRTSMNCRILLDGEEVGLTKDTALSLRDIPFGKHVVEAVTERHEGMKEVFLGVKEIQIRITLEEKGGALQVMSEIDGCKVRLDNTVHNCPFTLTDVRKGTYAMDIIGPDFQYHDKVRIEPLKETRYVINAASRESANLREAQERYQRILDLPEETTVQMRTKLQDLDRIVIQETRFDVSKGIEIHRRLTAAIRKSERQAEVDAAARAEAMRAGIRKVRRNAVIAIVAIVLIGTGLYLAYRHNRNQAAETAFRNAMESGLEVDFQTYMDRFGESSLHGPAVREELDRFESDRLAFANAQRTGSAAAFEAYLETFGSRGMFREEAQAQAQLMRAREKLPDIIETYKLVEIPAVTLFIGAAGSAATAGPDSRPPMYVKVVPFLIGSREVTWDEYMQFCKATGHRTPSDAGFGKGQRPVINVTFADANAYCRWLSQETGLDVRLPSEAEWETACRAGTVTRFFWGPVMNNQFCHSGQKRNGHTRPVSQTKPNFWGIYDMSGNVFEWCADNYRDPYDNPGPGELEGSSYRHSDRYDKNASGNPVFTAWGNRRVIRGGSFRSSDFHCGSSVRGGILPDTRRPDLGFRIALTLPN